MTREAEWIGPLKSDLDELAAFDAMRAFLHTYWERGNKSDDGLADLLSNLQRGIWKNGMPGDRAMWDDWKKSVETVRRNPGSAADDPFAQGVE